ncbi:MAG: hypothetical protein WKF79_00485 [Nocardioides sp.]
MNWLLISSDAGDEEVHAYSDGEMAELYTPEQRAELNAGRAVITKAWAGRALLRSVDMLVAARSVAN